MAKNSTSELPSYLQVLVQLEYDVHVVSVVHVADDEDLPRVYPTGIQQPERKNARKIIIRLLSKNNIIRLYK